SSGGDVTEARSSGGDDRTESSAAALAHRSARRGVAGTCARGDGIARMSIARIWKPLALLALLIGIWELFVDLGGADPLILPAPHSVAKALYSDRGLLWS